MKGKWRVMSWLSAGFLAAAMLVPLTLHSARNVVMGKLEFEGKSGTVRDSGVWIDGQYVGYMKELKGSKSVLLLPGEHQVSVRQDGYQDFTETVQIQPGSTHLVSVMMAKAPVTMPPVLATVKVAVDPPRAAVFVDGLYVGHAGELAGIGRGLLVGPGSHQIKIALPGYQTFQTEIKPSATQKVEIKTHLLKTDASPAEPLVQTETGQASPPAGPRQAATAQSH